MERFSRDGRCCCVTVDSRVVTAAELQWQLTEWIGGFARAVAATGVLLDERFSTAILRLIAEFVGRRKFRAARV